MATAEIPVDADTVTDRIRPYLVPSAKIVNPPEDLTKGGRRAAILRRAEEVAAQRRHEGHLRFIRSLYDPPTDPDQP